MTISTHTPAPAPIIRDFPCFGDDGKLGVNITALGWAGAFATRGAPDNPSLKESVDAGMGFMIDSPAGRHNELAGDPGYIAGKSIDHGGDLPCAVKMPTATGQIGPPGFGAALRPYTDKARAHGQESGIYLGCVPDGTLPASGSARTAAIRRMCSEIVAAMPTWVAFDVDGDRRRLQVTDDMEAVQAYLAREGIASVLEPAASIRQGIGRIIDHGYHGCLCSPTRFSQACAGAGSFLNPLGGAFRTWYVVVGGSRPGVSLGQHRRETVAAMRQCHPAVRCIVDPAGVANTDWHAMGGKGPAASAQTQGPGGTQQATAAAT